jgi:hypothetical protein
MEKTFVDLSIYEVFAIDCYCQRLLKHGLFWLKLITKWSSDRLKIALTVLGIIFTSVDTDLDTLSFKVVEVFNRTLNLVRWYPCKIGLNPEFSRSNSTECLIKVLLFVLIEEIWVKHWVKLNFEVGHIHLRVNSTREVVIWNTCHISVHLSVHYHWSRQNNDLQNILIIHFVHSLFLVYTYHIVTVNLENGRNLTSHIYIRYNYARLWEKLNRLVLECC